MNIADSIIHYSSSYADSVAERPFRSFTIPRCVSKSKIKIICLFHFSDAISQIQSFYWIMVFSRLQNQNVTCNAGRHIGNWVIILFDNFSLINKASCSILIFFCSYISCSWCSSVMRWNICDEYHGLRTDCFQNKKMAFI